MDVPAAAKHSAVVKKETLEIVGLDGEQALQADDKEHALRRGVRARDLAPNKRPALPPPRPARALFITSLTARFHSLF